MNIHVKRTFIWLAIVVAITILVPHMAVWLANWIQTGMQWPMPFFAGLHYITTGDPTLVMPTVTRSVDIRGFSADLGLVWTIIIITLVILAAISVLVKFWWRNHSRSST